MSTLLPDELKKASEYKKQSIESRIKRYTKAEKSENFRDFVVKRIEEITLAVEKTVSKNWNDKEELKSLGEALKLNKRILDDLDDPHKMKRYWWKTEKGIL